MRKVYVDVTAIHGTDGKITPTSIVFEGKTYAIQRITEVCRAASLKAGGYGIRYTVSINNKTTHLFLECINFNDLIGARWFVEGKQD